jgi:hypothetical protein
MYECLECMIGWQFGREISQRQTRHWKIGHIVARAATYSQRENLFGEIVVERRIKTMAEGSKTCKEGTLGRFLDTGRHC